MNLKKIDKKDWNNGKKKKMNKEHKEKIYNNHKINH